MLNWPPIYILHSVSMTHAWVIKEYSHILFWCIQLKAAKKKRANIFLTKITEITEKSAALSQSHEVWHYD